LRGNTHALLGAAVGAAVATVAHEPVVPLVAATAAGAVSGVLVDIDHPASLASRWLSPISILAPGFSEGPFRHGRRWLWRWKVYHREEIHSVGVGAAWMLLVGLGTLALTFDGLMVLLLMASTMGGWASHLLADKVNPSGIRWWLWPIRRRPFPSRHHSALLREGSFLETIIERVVSVVSCAALALLVGADVMHGLVGAVAAGR
jgi:membrane-bound metal-dependent hydrolase YbcI (DUF457 family)